VPFTFFDTKSNQIQGVMVDIITEIGKDAGFAVTLTLSSVPTTRERSFAGTLPVPRCLAILPRRRSAKVLRFSGGSRWWMVELHSR
jgi:hypothetical protein